MDVYYLYHMCTVSFQIRVIKTHILFFNFIKSKFINTKFAPIADLTPGKYLIFTNGFIYRVFTHH